MISFLLIIGLSLDYCSKSLHYCFKAVTYCIHPPFFWGSLVPISSDNLNFYGYLILDSQVSYTPLSTLSAALFIILPYHIAMLNIFKLVLFSIWGIPTSWALALRHLLFISSTSSHASSIVSKFQERITAALVSCWEQQVYHGCQDDWVSVCCRRLKTYYPECFTAKSWCFIWRARTKYLMISFMISI